MSRPSHSTHELDSALKALQKGSCSEVLAYLAAGGGVNDTGEYGFTILIRASEVNEHDMIELCFQHNVDVNHQNNHKFTALTAACLYGSAATIQLLFLLGGSAIDTRIRDNDGCTIFFNAVKSNVLDKVQFLHSLEIDLEINDCDVNGITPVHYAIRSGNIAMVKYLYSIGCDINIPSTNSVYPIYSAVCHKMYFAGVTHQNNLELTQLLFIWGASPMVCTSNGYTLLSGAVEKEDFVMTQYLLSSFSSCVEQINEITADGSSPLFRAVNKGNFKIAQLLISFGADVNQVNVKQRGTSPLVKACEKNDVQMATYLIRVGAELPTQLLRIQNAKLRTDLSTLAENRIYFPLQTLLHRNDSNFTEVIELIHKLGTSDTSICRLDCYKQTPYLVIKEICTVMKTKDTRAYLIEILVQVCKVVLRVFASNNQSQLFNSVFVKHLSTKVFPTFRWSMVVREKSDFMSSGNTNNLTESTLLYYEVCILVPGVVQIGVTAADWSPKSPTDGVGDDSRSVAFDGQRKCVWLYGTQLPLSEEVLQAMPVWAPGAVVGVAVNIILRQVSFFLNGIHMATVELRDAVFCSEPDNDGLPQEEQKQQQPGPRPSFAFTAAMTLSRGCSVRCNFGDTVFSSCHHHPDLSAFSIIPLSAYSGGGSLEHFQSDASVMVWSRVDNVMSDEFAVESFQDLLDFIANDSNAEILDIILSNISANNELDMHILCFKIKDPFGRNLLDLAASSCKKVLQSHLFFLKRYEFLTPNRPEHISDTCMVMLCKDHNEADESSNVTSSGSGGGKKNNSNLVALKIMKNHDEFVNERDSRQKCLIDESYVMGVLEFYDGTVDTSFAKELEGKGFKGYNYCLVMPAADRSLHTILAQENIAAKQWTQIKYIFTQIVNCVSHIHSLNLLHGDLKPLNVMRTELGNMILIDLDASVLMDGVSTAISHKYSSAFCPPEWASKLIAASQSPPNLIAHSSFDLWSLGAILFHMASGEPLFLSNNSDDIDAANLQILAEWDDDYKFQKLQKITNHEARNLVSRLLNKDPSKRCPISAILAHPFLSGRPATRMVGDVADFDVFISYRVASDSKHADIVYDNLTSRGLRVWYDKKCLLPGKNWEEGFCDGLVKSRSFVCLLSKHAIAHPTNTRQSFSQLSVTSGCDNVLLEHQLALEMLEMGMLEYVFPVFIGEEDLVKSTPGNIIYSGFDFSALGNMPAISIPAVAEKLLGHLDRQCLGVPLSPNRTVKETVTMITSCQGGFISGNCVDAFDTVAKSIHSMCVMGVTKAISSPSLPPPPLPSASNYNRAKEINDLYASIQNMASQSKTDIEIDTFICDFIKSLNII